MSVKLTQLAYTQKCAEVLVTLTTKFSDDSGGAIEERRIHKEKCDDDGLLRQVKKLTSE